MKYTADIGLWERGKNVDLPNAKTINEAISEALKICEQAVFDPPIQNPDVIQIRELTGDDILGQVVWDYWNGYLNN